MDTSPYDKNANSENDPAHVKRRELEASKDSHDAVSGGAAESSESLSNQELDAGAAASGGESNSSTSTSEKSGTDSPDENNLNYTGGEKSRRKNGIISGLKSDISKKTNKYIIAIGGGTLGGALVIIILLFLLANSLKIPNLKENITAFTFSRVTRQLAKSSERVTSERLALQAADDTTYAALKDKYQGFRDGTWGKFDKIRPAKIIETLGQDNGLKLNYTTSLTGREVFQSAELNGVKYEVKQVSGAAKWIPGLKGIVQTKNQSEFAGRFFPVLSDTLKTSTPNGFIQGLVATKLRSAMGIQLSGYDLNKYKGKNGAQAQLEEARERANAINKTATAADNSASQSVKDAVDKTKAAADETLNDDAKLKAAIANGGVSNEVATAVQSAGQATTTDKVIGGLNGFYAAAVPYCIIYDGSLQQSQPTIDNNVNQQVATYYRLASQSDMQKKGSPNTDAGQATELAAAVGAANDNYADVGNSNIQLMMSGQSVNTSDSNLSAEAGAAGSDDFSVLDAITSYIPGGQSIGITSVLDFISKTGCPVITNKYVAGGTAAAALISNIVDFGATEAGTEAVGQGVRAFTVAYIKHLISKRVETIGVKTVERGVVNRISRFASKTALQVGATEGLTLLANTITANRAGQINNGLAQSADSVNIASAGGDLAASQISQATYGRPLSNTEVAASDQADQSYRVSLMKRQSVYERYFATSNTNSLLSKVALSVGNDVSPNFMKTIINFGSMLFRPLTYFGTLFNSLSGRAHAASSDLHYGNVEWGWSEDEEKLIDSNNSYLPLQNSEQLDTELAAKNMTIDDLQSQYGSCFTDSMGKLLSSGDISRDSDGNIQDKGKCSPQNLGANNPDLGDIVFRWRLSNNYSSTMDQLASEQEVTTSNAGNTTGGNNTGQAGDIPTGTTTELANRILQTPNLSFQTDADKSYFEHIAITGAGTACGGPNIDPQLLGVLLSLSAKYKIVIGVLDDGHQCDSGFHPKGQAVDINGVNSLDGTVGTGNRISGNSDATVYTIDKPALHLLEQFYGDAGATLAKLGKGGLGQQQCFEGETPPKVSGVSYFNDSCNHLHMDIGQR